MASDEFGGGGSKMGLRGFSRERGWGTNVGEVFWTREVATKSNSLALTLLAGPPAHTHKHRIQPTRTGSNYKPQKHKDRITIA